MVVAALVGQARHARRQIEAGVDLLIAQGTEAGGHTGTIATMVLTPEIVDISGGRPVLAAGGIASGCQMAAALALGAACVWRGSVWLSSAEDVANQAIKDKFLRAASSDTLRSPTRTGKPARQLRSAWHDEWDRPDAPAPLPMPLQPMLVDAAWQRIDQAAADGHQGALSLASFYVGQVVGSFQQIRPARRDHPAVGGRVRAADRRTGWIAARGPTASPADLDPRTPVAAGVGQAAERLDSPLPLPVAGRPGRGRGPGGAG